MRRKLLISAFSMVVIILWIVVSNQVIIRLSSRFSNKLITEYRELHSLIELKVALSKTSTFLSLPENQSRKYNEGLAASLTESRLKLEDCRQILSDIHRGTPWKLALAFFNETSEKSSQLSINDEHEREMLAKLLYSLINQMIKNIDQMVDETMEEIVEYEQKNIKLVNHGSLTILVFGMSLIIFLTWGGWRLIKNLTKPIEQLVDSMKEIGKGNTKIRVHVDSDDEFRFLANSFNSMLEALNTTTVSKEFFSKILNNLYGALIVTDVEGNISFINETTCGLLKCTEEEIIGQDSLCLFNNPSSSPNNTEKIVGLDLYAQHLATTTEMKTLTGEFIPVYVTCNILKDQFGVPNGMIVVGHDLTEEKAHEERITKVRKKRLIAINEAEENERMRFAKDLHDGLGQILTGISYSLQNIKPSNNQEIELLEKLESQISLAIQETKNIARNLIPVILRDFGLIAALKNLVKRTNLLDKTQVLLNSYNFEERIDQRLEKAIYRICQECLNNIIKHAQAESATIELFRKPDSIVLVIEDNGVGFSLDALKEIENRGIGLMSIQERIDVFDGIFSIESNTEQGTEIMVEIPYAGNSQDNE